MGGHSDVMGGALIFADDAWYAGARHARELIGLNASPFAAWMVLRGLRSLSARMAMHCANARRVAIALAERSEEHTSELQSLMRISYAVFFLKKKKYCKH